MDKYEKFLDDSKAWSRQQMDEWKRKNGGICTCPDCPTYTDCARRGDERLYCVSGASPGKCIDTMQGCICPDCPMTDMLELQNTYYCMHGSEKEQRG
jgi:hypothetical protein